MAGAKEKNKELSNDCEMYDPCPLCFKCMNRATHLYQRCEECPVQFCGHSNKQRAMMIRRENFGIKVTDETGAKFKEAAEMCTCQEENSDGQEEAKS